MAEDQTQPLISVDETHLVRFPHGGARRSPGLGFGPVLLGYYPVTLVLSPSWQNLLVEVAETNDWRAVFDWVEARKQK